MSLKLIVMGLPVVGGILVIWGTSGLFLAGQRNLALALFGLWLVGIGLTMVLVAYIGIEVLGEREELVE